MSPHGGIHIKIYCDLFQFLEPTLTVVNVCAAMSMVKSNVRQVWLSAGLPDSVLDHIGQNSSSLKECNRLAAFHYINYSPNAAWEHLSCILYSWGEVAAVDKMIPFLPPQGVLYQATLYMQLYHTRHKFHVAS